MGMTIRTMKGNVRRQGRLRQWASARRQARPDKARQARPDEGKAKARQGKARPMMLQGGQCKKGRQVKVRQGKARQRAERQGNTLTRPHAKAPTMQGKKARQPPMKADVSEQGRARRRWATTTMARTDDPLTGQNGQANNDEESLADGQG